MRLIMFFRVGFFLDLCLLDDWFGDVFGLYLGLGVLLFIVFGLRLGGLECGLDCLV